MPSAWISCPSSGAVRPTPGWLLRTRLRGLRPLPHASALSLSTLCPPSAWWNHACWPAGALRPRRFPVRFHILSTRARQPSGSICYVTKRPRAREALWKSSVAQDYLSGLAGVTWHGHFEPLGHQRKALSSFSRSQAIRL